jgi:hypothetical protein
MYGLTQVQLSALYRFCPDVANDLNAKYVRFAITEQQAKSEALLAIEGCQEAKEHIEKNK